jgi:hypothetical protein
LEVIEVSILQDRGGWDANGVGEGPRVGNGSLDAERRGLDFDFLRGGVGCFGFSNFSSNDDELGSSSSYIPGMFGGRAIRLNWGEVGLVLTFRMGRRARGEGGVGGASTTCLML